MNTSKVNSNKAVIYEYTFLPPWSDTATPLLLKNILTYLNWHLSCINRKTTDLCLKLSWAGVPTVKAATRTQKWHRTHAGVRLQNYTRSVQNDTVQLFSPSVLCPSLLPTYRFLLSINSPQFSFLTSTFLKPDFCCSSKSIHKTNAKWSGCSTILFFPPLQKEL